MTNLDLPFSDAPASEIDAYLREIDDALDACFLSELDVAFARAAEARDEAPPPAAIEL